MNVIRAPVCQLESVCWLCLNLSWLYTVSLIISQFLFCYAFLTAGAHRTLSSCNAINSPLVLPEPLEPWEMSWILWRLWEVYGVVNEVWQNWYFVLYANYEVFCFPLRTLWQRFFVWPCAYYKIVYFILFLSTCLKLFKVFTCKLISVKAHPWSFLFSLSGLD